jgi:hypothetical protein
MLRNVVSLVVKVQYIFFTIVWKYYITGGLLWEKNFDCPQKTHILVDFCREKTFLWSQNPAV